MNSTKTLWVALVAVAVIAMWSGFVALGTQGAVSNLSAQVATLVPAEGYGATSNITTFQHGVQVGNAGSNPNTGVLNIISPSNAATSSETVGCIQTTATSTVTPIRFVISSIATSSVTFGGISTIGLVGWQYGTCPR